MKVYFCAPLEHYKDALSPVSKELEERGHEVIFTPQVPEDAKVAVYNGHRIEMDYIRGDKKIVTFHGIDDAYDPEYFAKERWNRFDIGLLPGEQSAKIWKNQSWNPMTRPKKGVYITGWPKADRVVSKPFKKSIETYNEKLGIKNDTVAIYAPTKECDGKITGCISAVDGIFDTLLIKHAPYDSVDYTNIPDKTPSGTKIIKIDSSENIMSVLAMGDVLISDQSSVLIEAILVDTIPISVSDWPIRFSDPPKYPNENIPSFVERITSTKLRSYLEELSNSLDTYKQSLKYEQNQYYSNIGTSTSAITKIIEGNEPSDIDKFTYVPARQNWNALISHVPELAYYKFRYGITDRISPSKKDRIRNSRLNKLVRFFDVLF